MFSYLDREEIWDFCEELVEDDSRAVVGSTRFVQVESYDNDFAHIMLSGTLNDHRFVVVIRLKEDLGVFVRGLDDRMRAKKKVRRCDYRGYEIPVSARSRRRILRSSSVEDRFVAILHMVNDSMGEILK